MVVLFALTLPIAIASVGMLVDYGYMTSRKANLQAAADAAALAGASEMQLANSDESKAKAVAVTVAKTNLASNSAGVSIQTKVASDPVAVTVNITQSPGLYIMGGMFGNKNTDITVHATARVVGNSTICALILEEKDKAALAVNQGAQITGNGCSVYSNSGHADGISTKNRAQLKAELICTAGGFAGDASTYSPQPLTDCPILLDPLSSRPAPIVGACMEDELEIEGGTRTLKPGTYCNGLSIEDAKVTFEAGVYVIKDGALTIAGNADVTGEHVGFYLQGDGSTFKMGPNTKVELSAPKDGVMAGILFFEDRNATLGRKHTIRSNGARSLIGTFYLSRGSLVIDATKPVFDQSAYTVLIVSTLDMFSGPNLVLNADYGATDVPVPDGLAGSSGKDIVLAE